MKKCAVVFALLVASPSTWAWGKRGHSIVCETAAYLVGAEPNGEFMKAHSFDMGYYCNVPDLVWKNPAVYSKEWFNHFMDMEIFRRELKGPEMTKAFALSRADFDKQYPKIKNNAGRAFWRIREFLKDADDLTAQLKNEKLTREQRQKLQAQWLVRLGTMGHYVGDLSQPLHVTENYDGKMSGQKGVHSWFEDDIVNELYMDDGADLEGQVMREARTEWKKRDAKWKKQTPLQIIEDVAESSNRLMPKLLKMDKKLGRKSIKKAAQAFRPMIVKRLATGAIAVAELWRRDLGWRYDGKKFYTFVSNPEFVPDGK